ncbi:hypothetical protein [uncultured Roseobacter sp.]|uniref:hypothetical protein n=1 Tax=uncultured Roseobacter sp. TaxID=114847 RepID=UPI00263641EE|nr:hypothetical protein [uncultured Roseobacter sp.]
MSDTVAYFVMCTIGAFILLIEAHRQFSSPIRLNNKSAFRILDNIELEDLAARRVLLRGYLFYMVLYLLVYALLLTCVQLGDMVVLGGEKNGAQGDLPFEAVDTIFLDREGVARPIYITLALITLLSTGWASKIERVLRAIAHRLAGIPSGIFRTVTRLNRLDLSDPSFRPHLARTRAFLAHHPQAGAEDAAQEDRYIVKGLRDIDAIAEPVVTPLRNSVFAQEDINALSPLLDKQAENIRALDAEIASGTMEKSALLNRIEEEKRNLQVLFAVLYFKDPHVRPPISHPPTAFLIDALNKKPRDFVFNGLIAGAVALFFSALLAGFAIEIWFKSALDNTSLFGLPQDEYAYRARKAIILAAQSVIIFIAVSMTIHAIRGARLCEGRYRSYTFQNLPYSRLVQLSLAGALMGVLAASFVLSVPDFVVALVQNGYIQLWSTAISSLSNALAEAFMYGGAMIFVAATVLLVADQHDNLPAAQTCLIAVVGTCVASIVLLMCLIADPGHSFREALRDGAIFGVISLTFLLCFAAIVETAEGQMTDAT